MSINVMIPSVLRPFTQGNKEVSVEGKTIADVIASLEGTVPRNQCAASVW